jgi:predicted transcriptional regulator
MSTFVLALRPHHAQRLYDGTKTWEFRRVRAQIPVGALVLVYESRGAQAITGQFVVAEVVHGTPEQVLPRERNALSRSEAAEYLAGAVRATALRASKVVRYPVAIGLSAYGLQRAPQSYVRIGER